MIIVTGGRQIVRRVDMRTRQIKYRANYGLNTNLDIGPIDRT
jgi:hypothetical protein